MLERPLRLPWVQRKINQMGTGEEEGVIQTRKKIPSREDRGRPERYLAHTVS